jgi:dolichyl-phosphate beta-glucosyltransferase
MSAEIQKAFERLSIVIPAYDAEPYLATTLDSIALFLHANRIEHEVLVVDDGSSDRTAEIARARAPTVRLIRNERNRGKGHAVRRGLRETSGDWALFMDADNSTAIDHLALFAACAAQADVLIGSRRLPGSVIVSPQPRLRQLLGRTFPYLVSSLALPHVRDSQCGFKLFRRRLIEPLFAAQRSNGFCFDVEVLLIATRLRYRIVELPVRWDNPRDSTLRLGLDPLLMLADLARIVWRHRARRSPALADARG